MNASPRQQVLRDFVDALRDCLNLEPLYGVKDGAPKSDLERFYARAHSLPDVRRR